MHRDLCAVLILCTSWYGTFRGFYRHGFELNEFIACEGPRTAASYLGVPVRATNGIAGVVSMKQAAQLRVNALLPTPETMSDGTIYMEWRGTYVGPGAFGVFGLSAFGLEIDTVFEARRPRATDCPAINPTASVPSVRFDTLAVLAEAWRVVRSSTVKEDSARPKPHPRAALMLSSTIDLETAHVSESVISAMRRRGVTIATVSHSVGSVESAKYVLLELRARDEITVRAIFYATWFGPNIRDGFALFRSRTDTVFVRCRLSVCAGL